MALRNGHAPGWFVTLDNVVIGDCGTHGDPDERGDIDDARWNEPDSGWSRSTTDMPGTSSLQIDPLRVCGWLTVDKCETCAEWVQDSPPRQWPQRWWLFRS
jgi:hypothetical protein